MAFMAAALLASCGGDDDKDYSGDYGQIKVPDTRQLEQTISADDTQAPQGVTFTTEGAWSSSITRTRADAPDWIRISPDHGDAAGSYTLKITLDSNGSEESRTAKIVITCGASKIEISVTQEGTDNPIVPSTNAPIREIKCYYKDTEYMQTPELEATYLFEYDKQNRVSEMKLVHSEKFSNDPDAVIGFSYPDATTLKLTVDGDPETKERKNYTVTLDSKTGYVTEVRRDGHTDRWTASYDADGYCTKIHQDKIENESFLPDMLFTWKNGNLTAVDSYDKDKSKVDDYSFTYKYTEKKNDTSPGSLDLNALLFNVNPGYLPVYGTDIGQVLATAGRLGRRSANLTATNMMMDEFSASSDGNISVEFERTESRIEWEQFSDGRVKSASYIETVRKTVTNNETKDKDITESTSTEFYEIHY